MGNYTAIKRRTTIGSKNELLDTKEVILDESIYSQTEAKFIIMIKVTTAGSEDRRGRAGKL